MKNFSKNNFSGKKNKQNKKNADPVSNQNTISSKKNTRFLSNSANNKIQNNFEEIEKKKNNFSVFKRTKAINNSNAKSTNKSSNIYQDLSNKKNFDDWIWGKHSVF